MPSLYVAVVAVVVVGGGGDVAVAVAVALSDDEFTGKGLSYSISIYLDGSPCCRSAKVMNMPTDPTNSTTNLNARRLDHSRTAVRDFLANFFIEDFYFGNFYIQKSFYFIRFSL